MPMKVIDNKRGFDSGLDVKESVSKKKEEISVRLSNTAADNRYKKGWAFVNVHHAEGKDGYCMNF